MILELAGYLDELLVAPASLEVQERLINMVKVSNSE
jgi:hypothetical protein